MSYPQLDARAAFGLTYLPELYQSDRFESQPVSQVSVFLTGVRSDGQHDFYVVTSKVPADHDQVLAGREKHIMRLCGFLEPAINSFVLNFSPRIRPDTALCSASCINLPVAATPQILVLQDRRLFMIKNESPLDDITHYLAILNTFGIPTKD